MKKGIAAGCLCILIFSLCQEPTSPLDPINAGIDLCLMDSLGNVSGNTVFLEGDSIRIAAALNVANAFDTIRISVDTESVDIVPSSQDYYDTISYTFYLATIGTKTVRVSGSVGTRSLSDSITVSVLQKIDTLRISSSGHGTTTPTADITFRFGTPQTITATADPGYYFVKWTIEKGSAVLNDTLADSTTIQFTTRSVSLKAVFSNQATLTMSKQGQGTVVPNNVTVTTINDTLPVTAQPAKGYFFKKWLVTNGSAVFTDSAMMNKLTGLIILQSPAVELSAIFTDTALTGLAVSAGSFTEPFDPKKQTFAISVPDSITSITVTPSTNQFNSTIYVSDRKTLPETKSQPVSLASGFNSIPVKVVSSDTITSIFYYIIVTRLPSTSTSLKSLTVSKGTIDPSFSSDNSSYTVGLLHKDSVVIITAVPTNAASKVAYDPSSDITFDSTGDTTVTITVTAQDGVSKSTYQVKIRRRSNIATLDTFWCTADSMKPAFSPKTTAYTVTVPHTTGSIEVNAVPSDTNAFITISKVNPVSLDKETTVVAITITAEDSSALTAYSLKIIRRQLTFKKSFGTGIFKNVVIGDDGFIYCAGAAGTYPNMSNVIYKLDSLGDTVLTKKITSGWIEDMSIAPGNKLLMCGYITGTAEDGWAVQVDANLQNFGNTLIKGSAQTDFFDKIIPKTEGGYLIGGMYNWDRTRKPGYAWLVNTDAALVFQNEKLLNTVTTGQTGFNSIRPDPAGGYLFAGYTFPNALEVEYAWYGKINAAGDALVWSKSYLRPGGDNTYFMDVVMRPDGGGLFVGEMFKSPSLHNGLLMRTQANGDSVWTKTVGSNMFWSACAASDGGYICQTQSSLIKVDENGTFVWEKTFPNTAFYSMAQAPDKSMVLVGGTSLFGTGTIVVYRVDKDGNL